MRLFLRPADLCAAASSSPLLQAMNGLFDVIVMTDGALVESLMKATLKMDLFHTVVFDECHQVTKSSRCQQILAKVGEGHHWLICWVTSCENGLQLPLTQFFASFCLIEGLINACKRFSTLAKRM